MRRIASCTFACPSTTFGQSGALASSKSAMNTLAPELRALMIILRSTGPVISTRRSCRSSGVGATRQSPSRTACVSARNAGRSPARRRACRSWRARSTSCRRGSKRRARSATNASASGVRTRDAASTAGPCTVRGPLIGLPRAPRCPPPRPRRPARRCPSRPRCRRRRGRPRRSAGRPSDWSPAGPSRAPA